MRCLSQALSLPAGKEPGLLYGCFGTPILPWAPQEVVGTGPWVLISLPLHLKQALNLGHASLGALSGARAAD